MFKIKIKLTYKFFSIFLLAGTFSSAGLAQEQIGVASAVNKNTTDLTLEQERKLIDAGYEIIQNHTIETDDIGRAQMLLLDGTAFSVGPNSSVVLDKFIYNPETAEGSLEVTARGLLRIVGGKVTKKQPALIRTNSATVGIRGGIGIVQTNGSQTNATFLYGTEMTVTPNCVDLDSFGDQCSPDYATTVTEPGFSVSVESEDSEPSEPVEVTEESIDALQEELEAPEEAPEEESAAEETPAEENQEEESTQKKLRLRRPKRKNLPQKKLRLRRPKRKNLPQKKLRLRRLKQTRELQVKRQQLKRLLPKRLLPSLLSLKPKHLQRLKPKSQAMMPAILPT